MSYFVYDGTSIKTLLPGSELEIGVLDSFDEIDGNLGREIIKGEVNSERYSPNYITSLFNEVVNFDLFIYKKDGSDFATDEQRKLTKLLTKAKTPKWLSTYDNNDNLIANYRGLFTNITYKIFSGLKGLQVHFENDSPYDYDKTEDMTVYTEMATLINSDADEKIYPIIKISDVADKRIKITETIGKLDFVPEYNRNLVTGSYGLEIDALSTGNWENKKWRTSGTGNTTNIEVLPTPEDSLRYGIKLEPSETAQLGIAQNGVPLIEGKTYTLSCWVRANTDNIRCRLQVFYKSSTDSSGTRDFIVGTTWTRLSFTANSTPNQSGKYNVGYVYILPTDIGNYIEVCGIKVEEGTSSSPWCFAIEDITYSTADKISMQINVPTTNELYIDCKNCMFYTKKNDEIELIDYATLGITEISSLQWFYLCTEEGYINKFECYETDVADNKYSLSLSYITPQKRAFRWE